MMGHPYDPTNVSQEVTQMLRDIEQGAPLNNRRCVEIICNILGSEQHLLRRCDEFYAEVQSLKAQLLKVNINADL